MECSILESEKASLWGWCDFTAGWCAGLAGIVVGHPADTLKVRQQTLQHLHPLVIAKNTLKYEGVRGFFKGMMFPAISAGVLNSVFFGIYGNSLRQLQSFHGADDQRRTCAEGNYPLNKYWHLDVFLAGSISGVSQVVLGCPIEVIKIKLQAQTGTKTSHWANHYEAGYKGSIDCSRKLFQEQGIKGFYKGVTCMLWRDVPTFGLYVLTYEHLLSVGRSATDFTPDYSVTRQIIAGGIAGCVSWALILPLDVVKSRLQADSANHPVYKGIYDCFVKSYRSEGLTVFGRGFMLINLRAFIVNAAVFVALERCLNFCKTVSEKVLKRKENC